MQGIATIRCLSATGSHAIPNIYLVHNEEITPQSCNDETKVKLVTQANNSMIRHSGMHTIGGELIFHNKLRSCHNLPSCTSSTIKRILHYSHIIGLQCLGAYTNWSVCTIVPIIMPLPCLHYNYYSCHCRHNNHHHHCTHWVLYIHIIRST